MDRTTFQSIRRLVHERSGIDLKEGKANMVSARIARRLRELNLASAEVYLEHLRRDTDEIVQLLNVISTNVTRFFREQPHFDFLERVLLEWFGRGQGRLRIWSAASSTGQEPYSILMTVNEVMRKTKQTCDFRLLATDISTRVLERAEAGFYSEAEVESIPEHYRQRYLHKTGRGGAEAYQVDQVLRDQVIFRRLNLNEPPFPMRGLLDLVFCCNVMIYFDAQTKRNLLHDIHRLLRPDGYVIVSHTESLTGLTDLFSPVQPSIYAKSAAVSHRKRQTQGAR